jgi:phosphonatase-like hydrolase
MKPIKLVVFDLAGTTISDAGDVSTVLCDSFDRHGIEVSHDGATSVMGISKRVAIEMMLVELGHSPQSLKTQELVNSIHRSFIESMIHHYTSVVPASPIDGVEEVLAHIYAEGKYIYFDTGFGREITDAIIDIVGWKRREWYRGVVCSDDVDHGRPYPDMIYEIMRRCAVRYPDRVAKVGDTPSDMKQGEAAGCELIIGVTYGTHAETPLRIAGATAIAHEPREVLIHLGIERS